MNIIHSIANTFQEKKKKHVIECGVHMVCKLVELLFIFFSPFIQIASDMNSTRFMILFSWIGLSLSIGT